VVRRKLRAAVVLVAALALLAPQAAHGHAQLVGSEPERGATLERAPSQVVFRFNERVEAAFGAVRVYDAAGNRVDDDRVARPDGDRTVGVGLRSGLKEGTYIATFRVVSADGHPVNGGMTFTVGAPAAVSATVGELLERGESGPVTEVAFGAARGLGYAAIAVAVGALAFLWLVAGRIERARSAVAPAVRRMVLVACAVGAAATALAIVGQGAVAGGTSYWAAFDPDVVREVLDTRFGMAAAVRLVAWVVLAVAAARLLGGERESRPRALIAAAFGMPAAALVVTPGLGGHAGATSPKALMLGADIVHVAAMSVWLGGLAAMLLALPAATRRLPAAERTAVLAEAVSRFSTVAIAAVVLVVAGGVAQSLKHLTAVADLRETAFGRAIAIKVLLLAGLVAIGAYNRQRLRPRLERLAAGGSPPGDAGRALRTALRAEVLLAIGVLGVTAALTAYPPATAVTGMYSTSQPIGTLRLELTAEPLRVGPQEIHLYLLDPRTGAPWDESRDIEATLSHEGEEIGPLPVELDRAGPGHYVALSAPAPASGSWTLRVTVRESRFDVHSSELELRIR